MLLDFFLKTEQAAIYILHQDNLVPLSPLDTEWSSGCGCLPSLSLSLSPLLSQSQTEWPSCYGYSLLSPLQTEWSSCYGYLSPLPVTDRMVQLLWLPFSSVHYRQTHRQARQAKRTRTYPDTRPMPVMMPPAGTSSFPYSWYPASWLSSRKGDLHTGMEDITPPASAANSRPIRPAHEGERRPTLYHSELHMCLEDVKSLPNRPTVCQ